MTILEFAQSPPPPIDAAATAGTAARIEQASDRLRKLEALAGAGPAGE